VGLLLLAPGAGADDEAPTEAQIRARVEAWLKDLRSPEFAVREEARRGLEEHGAEAADLLEAHRDDRDPEVRRTVRLLLERMGHPEPVPEAPRGDLEAVGLVSLEAKGTIPFLLRTLAEGYGVAFDLPDDVGQDFVEVSLEQVPFFEALETIAEAGGLSADAPFDAGGRLPLVRREEGEARPSAAAGPMRVTVVEVTSVRTLTPGGGRRYEVALDLQWIPTVQLVTRGTPKDVTARDDAGGTCLPGGAMRQNMTWGISAGARTTRVQIHLEPEGDAAGEGLAELAFTLPVRLLRARREVRFEDLAGLDLPASREVPRPGQATPDRVTLRAVDREGGDQGPWVVDLLATLSSAVAQDSLAVVLLAADGTARPASAGTRFPGADGTVGLRARAYGRWEESPVAVAVSYFDRHEDGELTFTLRGIPLR